MFDKENTAWGLLPSINFEIDGSNCKRKHQRTNLVSTKEALNQNVTYLPVKMATTTSGQCTGMILDFSENGCRIAVPVQLEEGELVKVGFIVKKRKIISKAIVRWISHQSHVYLAGVEFQVLPSDAKDFIRSISAVALLDNLEISKMEHVFS